MFTVTDDQTNQSELSDQQVDDLCGDWQDPFRGPDFLDLGQGQVVWDDSAITTKARWGDLLVLRFKEIGIKELVYVAPRVGWAGISLAGLAARHHVKLTLFMPASARASNHQLCAIERGASPIFARIAAMPNLNKLARDYAVQKPGAAFVPFGLNHQLVTAAGVRSTRRWTRDLLHGAQPQAVLCAVSTGVLTRTLQVAWPDSTFYGIAVARNIQQGERGRADVLSYPKPFQTPSKAKAPFSTEPCYDLKAWEYVNQFEHLPLFWNVAGEIKPESLTPEDVDSTREWGDPPRIVRVVRA